MDYNKIATSIVAELKGNARRTDKEIAERLGISRQAYIRRRDSNRLTTEDITSLSAWLVTAFGGGFYLDKHHSIKRNEANQMTNYNERLAEQLNYLMEYSYKYGRCEIPSSEDPPLIIARQAKQALTSLTKELVADAKPGYKPISKYAASTYSQGFNQAVDEFEQNLLKALEEV